MCARWHDGAGMPRKGRCAYCGALGDCTKDHVIPRALYPASLTTSRIQRRTVSACRPCNANWENDEPHFRNVLLMCGGSSEVVNELWEGETRRSFQYCDGRKRVIDLAAQMVPVKTTEGQRHKVFPANDPRVMRIVRKVARGLCHYHGVMSPVLDSQVWADIQRVALAPKVVGAMVFTHAEKEVIQYGVVVTKDHDKLHSFWVLRFFNRVSFVCLVYQSPEALARDIAA